MGAVVLAISGSLRKRSFTEKMLVLCIEGMGDGIEVHKFYPHRMNIGPCDSCWSCWGRKTPGECVQKDDFQEIIEVYKRADYFLLAAPLYVFGFPATVKNMLDRFFVIVEPAQIESASGHTTHPTRFGRHPQTALISSCGFPELDNFDILRRHFRLICEHMGLTWAGEILIPASGIARAPKLFDRKYDLIRAAGKELVRGSISPETTDAIAAPVMPAADYRRMATLSFEGTMTAKAKMAMIAIKSL
ncbi:MAG: NAD(P)H-dependent oxidoreductase [Deltaproteobacteria bacterium]|nr:NAD(P)H-dependent oxidoreductase [Deltaproteobacteria bacterium]